MLTISLFQVKFAADMVAFAPILALVFHLLNSTCLLPLMQIKKCGLPVESQTAAIGVKGEYEPPVGTYE